MTSETRLKEFEQLVGSWTTEASHPAMGNAVVRGTVDIEWLEGGRFLIHRARNDHPEFPDSISIIGFTERDRVGDAAAPQPDDTGEPPLTMHYFDSRGVFRVYEVSFDDGTLRFQRNAPGFSQRFTGTFFEGGRTLVGRWQLCQDDVHWEDDLQITYRRRN